MKMRMLAAALACVIAVPALAQVKKEAVPGVNNYAGIETTVACGGTITPSAIVEIKMRGFKSIVDLQLPDEKGADVKSEQAGADAAGLAFIHVPFNTSTPDLSSVDRFLAEMRKPANNPAFIHCASGNRAAGFWFIKRVLVDNWDNDRAMSEAEELGLSSSGMKQFAVNYVSEHRK